MAKKPKSSGKAWARSRIQKRIRKINRIEKELRAFERRSKPKKLRRHDKKLAQVMDAFFIILGKVRQALEECKPEEVLPPVPMPKLNSVPPSGEQSDGLHRAVPTEKLTPAETVEPTQPLSPTL